MTTLAHYEMWSGAGSGKPMKQIKVLIVEEHLAVRRALAARLDSFSHIEVVATAPSFAEGLPVVLMEALAMQRPVVTTFIAGIPELVDAECGWIVPAGSVGRLTDALRDVLETPLEQLQCMGLRGAERVRQQHDVQSEAARLADLFRHVVQGSHSS